MCFKSGVHDFVLLGPVLLFAIQMMETFETQMVQTEVGFKAGPFGLTQITLFQMRSEIFGLQGFAGGGAHELRR
jgi:hypothetical protein